MWWSAYNDNDVPRNLFQRSSSGFNSCIITLTSYRMKNNCKPHRWTLGQCQCYVNVKKLRMSWSLLTLIYSKNQPDFIIHFAGFLQTPCTPCKFTTLILQKPVLRLLTEHPELLRTGWTPLTHAVTGAVVIQLDCSWILHSQTKGLVD